MAGHKINILGCMGVGKTSVVQQISDKASLPVYQESFENNPYWKKTYNGEKSDPFKMQIHFLHQYINRAMTFDDNSTFVLDSHLYPGLVFTEAMYRLDMMDSDDYVTYKKWFLSVLPFLPVPTVNIYLSAEPKVILDRIKSRGREEEAGIFPSFISELCKCWSSLARNNGFVVIDANEQSADAISDIILDELDIPWCDPKWFCEEL